MTSSDQRDLVAGEAGLHRDANKPRLSDIMDWPLLLRAGEIWARNCQPTEKYPGGKYPDIDGKPNYQAGIQTSKLLDSCQRHLTALHQGIDDDAESGIDHAAHLLCCLSMFAWMRDNRPDMDNRQSTPKPTSYLHHGMKFVMTTKTRQGRDRVRLVHCPHCGQPVTLDTADMPFTHWCLECGEPFRAIVGSPA